jgi:hypothetical protein
VLSARANSSRRLSNKRGRNDRLARIGPAPEGGVDLGEQRLAEAARQAGARQAEQVADLAQAHPLQRLPVLAAGAEQPHRRGGERLPRRRQVQAARRRRDAGEDRRALRRRRGGDADGVAERSDRPLQALQAGDRCRRSSAGSPALRAAPCPPRRPARTPAAARPAA